MRSLNIGGCNRFLLRRIFAILVITIVLSLSGHAAPDLTIVARTTSTFAGNSITDETFTYIKSDRKRVERHEQLPQPLGPPGQGAYFVIVDEPPIVRITRCDLDKQFVLSFNTREYISSPLVKPPSQQQIAASNAQRRKEPAPIPTLLIETDTEDTGERKQMFGYAARHVIVTQKHIPLVETAGLPQENVTDGWYVDVDTSIPCESRSRGVVYSILTASSSRAPGEPPEIPVLAFKNAGKLETGLALATRQTNRLIEVLPDGSTKPKEDALMQTERVPQMEVTELSAEPLDDSLFEIPKNFREVQQFRRTPIVPYWRQAFGYVQYYWMRLARALGIRAQ
jgi:hypothetical protein